jgi:hypothetical protein
MTNENELTPLQKKYLSANWRLRGSEKVLLFNGFVMISDITGAYFDRGEYEKSGQLVPVKVGEFT